MATLTLAQKYFVATREQPSEDDEVITISTIDRDREGDRVLPEGGDFANFMKNPILLWAHGGKEGYGSIPIGSVTGLTVEPGVGVKASFRFLENDPFADRIKNAYNQNVIRASSIGFKPVKATPNGQGYDHEAWQLLELSLCAIPMNPECVRALKAVGLTDEEIASPFPVDVQDFVIQKRGRVLSAVNESRLRAALEALANANGVLTEVLAQLMPMRPDDMPGDMPDDDDMKQPMKPAEMPDDMDKPHKPKPMMALDDPAAYSLKLAEDHAEPSESGTVLRLLLADDDAGDSVITLVDDEGREPTFAIDPVVMRTVVADVMREQLHTALVEPIGESLQRALDRARGRVQ